MCVCVCDLLYPFIHGWTLRLFPYLGYYKQGCSELAGNTKTIHFLTGFIQFRMHTKKKESIPGCGINQSMGGGFLSPSVQFSSVAQSCPTLCGPMNHSTPGLPVHYQLLEFTQTHVHRVGDTIQPPHPLLSPSPPAPNPSQHQGLFK